MSLDAALKRVADKGLLLNNLFQHNDGTWQANLRKVLGDNMSWTEFGTGPTADAAIDECLRKPLITKKFQVVDSAGMKTAPEPSKRRRSDLNDI